MKRQPFYLPRNGKLVTQLPGGITFAYNLRLGHLRDRWKGPAEEYIDKLKEQKIFSPKQCPKKCRLGPQIGPGILGPEKLPKNCQSEIIVLSQWNGGWPPISTWINPPPLGGNGLHCIECPH